MVVKGMSNRRQANRPGFDRGTSRAEGSLVTLDTAEPGVDPPTVLDSTGRSVVGSHDTQPRGRGI